MYFNRFYVFIFVLNLYGYVQGDDLKDDGLDSKAHSDRGGLWFGPRLGKRSMDVNGNGNRQLLLKLLEAADTLKFYYSQLPYDTVVEEPDRVYQLRTAPNTRDEQSQPHQVVLTPILGRSVSDKRTENMEFTPRLGRRLADDGATTPHLDRFSPPDSQSDGRMFYTPRLGRNISFSPRLGRDLAYGMYPDRIRFVRSAKTKSN